ncbi:CD320 antigen isoform X2 [Pogoniulus pusillus]|uniref:CD320 antigen isoform X2 n=1 Tax=Pogoniulus pusillus TaxID=488313 RepID=UPI0030B989DE
MWMRPKGAGRWPRGAGPPGGARTAAPCPAGGARLGPAGGASGACAPPPAHPIGGGQAHAHAPGRLYRAAEGAWAWAGGGMGGRRRRLRLLPLLLPLLFPALLPAPLPSPPPGNASLPASGCPSEQFPCKPGSCIRIEWRCDGHPDCDEGEDEWGCDEHLDCRDGEDEWGCETATPTEPSPADAWVTPPRSSAVLPTDGAETSGTAVPEGSVPSRTQGHLWILVIAGKLLISGCWLTLLSSRVQPWCPGQVLALCREVMRWHSPGVPPAHHRG